MKLLYILPLLVSLTGCATLQSPEFVSKPPPLAVMPVQPVWAIEGIDKTTTDGEVSKRWLAFRVQALGYIKELQTTLEPYTKAIQ